MSELQLKELREVVHKARHLDHLHRHISPERQHFRNVRFGGLEHTGVLTLLILEARETKGNLSVLWLDQANAFGSIPHKLFQLTLKKHHVPSRCRDLIAGYYNNFRMRVSSGAITSSWHKVEISITTGFTISVTLFSLAMNMLTKSAEPECRGPRTNSGQRQPSIRALMNDLTVTPESDPCCWWILKGREKLVECARIPDMFQTHQIQINGAEEREGGGQVPF